MYFQTSSANKTAATDKLGNVVLVLTCGDCYGAKTNETHCCNTCQDVIDAYREKRWNPITEKFEQCRRENYIDIDGEAKKLALNEGCQIYGYMEVNRVWMFGTNRIQFCNTVVLHFEHVLIDGREFSCGTGKKFLSESHTYP